MVGIVVVQIIIFAVVIYALKRIMLGNTETAVSRLNESYADVNKKKEELVVKIEQIEQEYQKRKEEADKIVSELREAAELEMTEKREKILQKAREDAEKIVAETTVMKDKLRADIQIEERVKLAEYCDSVLNTFLNDVVREEIDQTMIEVFIGEVKETDANRIPPGLTEVEVVSGRELKDDMKARIRSTIHEVMNNKDVKINAPVDKTLIGGIVIKFGSLVLDGSITGRLNEGIGAMKRTIEEGGG